MKLRLVAPCMFVASMKSRRWTSYSAPACQDVYKRQVQGCPTGVLSFGEADKNNQIRKLDRLPASLVQIRENPAARARRS